MRRPQTRGLSKHIAVLAVVIVLAPLLAAVTGLARADQMDKRLPSLFEQLLEAPDIYAGGAVEAEIWRVWLHSDRADVNRLVEDGIQAMNGGRLDKAIRLFGEVTELAPEFAEGWNKRATAYYLAGRLEESVQDIHKTLALEPRHFGAIAGLGLIFLSKGDKRGALKAFQEVLKIHPRAPSANLHVERLSAMLGEKGA